MAATALELTIAIIAWVIALGTVTLVWIVAIEIIAALASPRGANSHRGISHCPATIVLVPANNEEASIGRCLASIFSDLPPNARVLVVAHNCTDDTARISREMGAGVIEVSDERRGGKPDALKWGLAALDSDPPEVIVIIDADCVVKKGAVSLLAETAWRCNRPAMGSYLFAAPSGTDGIATLSSLATLLKNLVRPLGLHALGLPCLLGGSGSAYPFGALRKAPQGEGSIAEDYQLTIDLLRLGYPSIFVSEARIDTQLPARPSVALRQRRRWEHGHILLAAAAAPKLFIEGLRLLDRNRIAIALELAVPPLALLGLMWFVVALSALILFMIDGAVEPLLLLLGTGLLFAILVVSAWLRFAGAKPALTAIAALPRYVLWKLPLYADFFFDRETRWTKTGRD